MYSQISLYAPLLLLLKQKWYIFPSEILNSDISISKNSFFLFWNSCKTGIIAGKGYAFRPSAWKSQRNDAMCDVLEFSCLPVR